MKIDYKSYSIQLSPVSEDYNFGVKGEVFLTEERNRPGLLFDTTFMNNFPTDTHTGRSTRTSRQTAQKVVEKCKAWIDKRAELYTAIQKVVSEESCLG
jgi:hypothetical protein